MNNIDKEFLDKIREAIFANPFGKNRLAIDLSAAGMNSSASTNEILTKLVHKVGKTVAAILDETQTKGKRLGEEDTALLRFGMLFYLFHIFCHKYDAHIQTQVKQGDKKVRLDFAGDLLKMLYTYGFHPAESKRFLSLFFQMRRAFYFINRIVGSSAGVRNLRRELWNNVFTRDIRLYDQHLWNRMEDFSTMILGETGTGKGMAAAAIGRSGYIPFDEKTSTFKESFAETFISINLSQYPEQLIESELFGHKKGAFTGAVEAHKGIFNRCSPHGSIFLDEIGDVSVHVQIKLLRILQDRIYNAVGSHTVEKFHGRVIAATNQSLDKARKDKKFRDDFYYRLCSDVINVPPLRQRLQENPKELEEILTITIERILGRKSLEIVHQVHSYITSHQPKDYHWPGNIRELEQCVRRILLNGKYQWQSLGADHLQEQDLLSIGIREGKFTAAELQAKYCAIIYGQLGTYEAVAQKTKLDRRTVKKYITQTEQD